VRARALVGWDGCEVHLCDPRVPVSHVCPGSPRNGFHTCIEHVTLRASHVVSQRDLLLCVLPGWQFNVNVNVNTYCNGFRLWPTFGAAFVGTRVPKRKTQGICTNPYNTALCSTDQVSHA